MRVGKFNFIFNLIKKMTNFPSQPSETLSDAIPVIFSLYLGNT